MSTEPRRPTAHEMGEHASRATLAASWRVVLSGPLAWALQLQVVYALSGWPCEHEPIALHVTSVVCLAVAVWGAHTAWRERRRRAEAGDPEPDERARGRARLMMDVGIVGGSLYSLLILAQWIAVMVLDPCAR